MASSLLITDIDKGSPAEKADIRVGDRLVSINKKEINDVLDYKYYTAVKKLVVRLESGVKKIKKGEYEDLGLSFETYLMSEKKHCRNNCIFCFINQLPKNMRETLYFKDDDARLSFLQGNYITLTNLTDEDVKRIIDMKLGVNVSVHTTNPELRIKMLNNPHAGEKLSYLYKMAAAGINLNCQLVLCPGINDGEELKNSLKDLTSLYPSVSSIACVPVGQTKFRNCNNLPELMLYDKESAAQVIDIIEEFGDKFYKEYGDRLVYPADEFFLIAEREIPDYDYYGSFMQYENGVGMSSLLEHEFIEALPDFDGQIMGEKSIATGVLAEPIIKKLVNAANSPAKVFAIENKFFGETITVAGLVTGNDLIEQLMPYKSALGDELLIPENMLKADENIFLDDVTVDDVERSLNIKVKIVKCEGGELLSALLK